MSYCVNCGVELDSSAKKCALCDTPVQNPATQSAAPEPPYPAKFAIPSSVSKKYVAFILSVIILIPNAVCLVTNLLMPHTGNWSLYVISSSLLAWIFAVLPLMFKKINPYFTLAVDTLAALAYEYVFYSEYKEAGWFLKLAAPLTVVLALFCTVFIMWARKAPRGKLPYTVVILTDVAIYSLVTDALISSFRGNDRLFFVSIIISVSCICFALFAYIVEKNERFKAWLSRRMYY